MILSKKNKTMLKKVDLNYTADERAGFESIEIFRTLAHREMTEPLSLGLLKKG